MVGGVVGVVGVGGVVGVVVVVLVVLVDCWLRLNWHRIQTSLCSSIQV